MLSASNSWGCRGVLRSSQYCDSVSGFNCEWGLVDDLPNVRTFETTATLTESVKGIRRKVSLIVFGGWTPHLRTIFGVCVVGGNT